MCTCLQSNVFITCNNSARKICVPDMNLKTIIGLHFLYMSWCVISTYALKQTHTFVMDWVPLYQQTSDPPEIIMIYNTIIPMIHALLFVITLYSLLCFCICIKTHTFGTDWVPLYQQTSDPPEIFMMYNTIIPMIHELLFVITLYSLYILCFIIML